MNVIRYNRNIISFQTVDKVYKNILFLNLLNRLLKNIAIMSNLTYNKYIKFAGII